MTILRQRQVVYGARDTAVDTKTVLLTHPTSGATTQEDANKLFDERIKALESSGGGGPLTEVDGGIY